MTYIPNYNCFRDPFHSDLEILSQRDVIIQEFQEVVAFLLLVSDDFAGDFIRGKWLNSPFLFAPMAEATHIAGSHIVPSRQSPDASLPPDEPT